MPKKKIRIKSYTRKRNGRIERVKSHDRNINYNLGKPPETSLHKRDYDIIIERERAISEWECGKEVFGIDENGKKVLLKEEEDFYKYDNFIVGNQVDTPQYNLNGHKVNVIPLNKLTIDNLAFLEYELLKFIDFYKKEYNEKPSRKDILGSFDDDEEWVIDDTLENLRSKGLLSKKGYNITDTGERLRREFKKKWDDDGDDDDFDDLMHERQGIYDKLRWIDNKIAFNDERMRKKPKELDYYLEDNRDLTEKQEELGERLGEIEEWMDENYDDDLSEW